jgi:hypothetical protein
LGVTLSSDAKWNNHIENIILSVSRHLGILRKLKEREELLSNIIYINQNSKGPKTDPWGTPAETSQTVDDVALLITFCFL